MGKWFCIWQFSDNRKINLNLEPKPAVVPERWATVTHRMSKIDKPMQFHNRNFINFVLANINKLTRHRNYKVQNGNPNK